MKVTWISKLERQNQTVCSMRQESLHHLSSQRRQGLFTVHSLQHYSRYLIYNGTCTVLFSQKFIWLFPCEEALLKPPTVILCPGSLDSSSCFFSHALFPCWRPSCWALPSIRTPLPAHGFPPLTKVHSFTDSPCRTILPFLSHALARLPLYS